MSRYLLAGLLLAATLIGACRFFLPERYAVNAPILADLLGWSVGPPSPEQMRDCLTVPDGFTLQLYAQDLANARFMRVTPHGDLLLSRPRDGVVMLIERDVDGDGAADGQRVLVDGLNRPHGMDLHDGWLYVAETDAVGRIRFDAEGRTTVGDFERVITGLPAGGNHTTRTVRFGPDGWLYVSVGSSCNVCEEADERRAALLRYRPDGSQPQLYATGLRNGVGFDWQPRTGELYVTDNGRDLLGDDFPPCELNRVEQGGFYGWPYANGWRVPDPDYGLDRDDLVRASLPPDHGFGAHTAPLGIVFLRHAPEPHLRDAALVALHGSWNRTRKSGYKVVSLHWSPGGIEERDFLSGFELDEDVIGRPVDVVEDAEGHIYVSDDYAGVIYRVVRGADAPRGLSPTPVAPRRGTASWDPGQIERGRALYEAQGCPTCHDPARAAPGVVPSPLMGLATRHDLASLAALLVTPPAPMPLVNLPEDDRLALASYLLKSF